MYTYALVVTNRIHLMMALKPIEDSSRGIFTAIFDYMFSKTARIDLCFPENLHELKLTRIFRCFEMSKLFEDMM